jgi:hypothetical protein
VSCHFCSSNRHFILFVRLHSCIAWKDVSWLMPVLTNLVSEFGIISTPTWSICLSVNTPLWSPWDNSIFRFDFSNNFLIRWFPVSCWINLPRNSVSSSSQSKRTISSGLFWRLSSYVSLMLLSSTKSGMVEKCWLVDEFISSCIITNMRLEKMITYSWCSCSLQGPYNHRPLHFYFSFDHKSTYNVRNLREHFLRLASQ